MEYYKTEHINNSCILTIACNPKVYYEVFEDSDVNKKHKRIKKGSGGMGFENFANRINSLTNFETFEKSPAD